MEIVIFKSTRRLELWGASGELLAAYPIGIGKEDKGSKKREGDMKTPEGRYRVCVKNPKSKFYLSLGLNYPNDEDALLGLSEGFITEEQYQEICQRNLQGQVPLWDTALGGKIYIHGDLESQAWSEGCIRMRNPDVENLFSLVEKGTPVTSLPYLAPLGKK